MIVCGSLFYYVAAAAMKAALAKAATAAAIALCGSFCSAAAAAGTADSAAVEIAAADADTTDTTPVNKYICVRSEKGDFGLPLSFLTICLTVFLYSANFEKEDKK